MKSIGYYLTHPMQTFAKLVCRCGSFLPDKVYLKMQFRAIMGKKLDLKNPKTFNEKLQWLKLYDRKSEYTTMVDKYLVKKYVADKIGDEYIIPTLGVWNSADEIDFDSLPKQFVLKCNHNSGGLVICKDKSKLDIAEVKEKLSHALREDYYIKGREFPYKNVQRKIIAEKFMVDESGFELKDYKFFCFDGQPKFFKIDFGRFKEHRANYYDMDGNLLPFAEVECMPNPERCFKLPSNFKDMINIVSALSTNISFVRIDLYNINGQIYFGEITFYPASGFGIIDPVEWDEKIGSWIKL
ncbi:MAG: glycosyl transferase [Bacteroidales bacterium]|nr:glycosyl transferase [Bacteroidales bacterium]